jgi:hypothetical protein
MDVVGRHTTMIDTIARYAPIRIGCSRYSQSLQWIEMAVMMNRDFIARSWGLMIQ